MSRLTWKCFILIGSALWTVCACSVDSSSVVNGQKTWLAGDHHVHSRYSVGWDYTQSPRAPIIGGDAIYPTAMNGLMGRHHGLSWIVTTDHGGPEHAKINRDIAYPELLRSRQVLPDLIQFYGVELNTPGGDHSSLILPHTHDEVDVLFELESKFDKGKSYDIDIARDTEERMVEALIAMSKLPSVPVVIANHPSRSAFWIKGVYGDFEPAEFRRWNDAAPGVAVGMAGAPGHQAAGLTSQPRMLPGSKAKGRAPPYRSLRGGYPTLGGFDRMTAIVGGFWDSMLGEGRRWWITANSDSHVHVSEGGSDFWPGEYSKTYVYAERNYDDILSGLRAGHVFVTTGDLVSEVDLVVVLADQTASTGDEIHVTTYSEVQIQIKVRDPSAPNASGANPIVKRIDIITGEVRGKLNDPTVDSNPTANVIRRFSAKDWNRDGEYLTMTYPLTVKTSQYVRIRGTNTDEMEPEQDWLGENPWTDLWFYSNPVFITTR